MASPDDPPEVVSSHPLLVEAPQPDATCRLVGSSDLVASRPPVDLGVLGYGSVPGNLAHLVLPAGTGP